MDIQKIAASLATEQKARLEEVASLLQDIYTTLVDMRYIAPQALLRGPLALSPELLAKYAALGLDPAIIYLYSILPCIDEHETDARDFFQGSAFFDPRAEGDVDRGRDPFFASPIDDADFDVEDGAYMFPWYTPLSNCGNHSPVLVYDAREHRIWMVDQIARRTTDPAFVKGWYREAESVEKGSDWGESGESEWSGESEDDDDEDDVVMSDDGASNGSSEFWDDDEEMVASQELVSLVKDQAEDVDYDEGFEHVEELEEWEREEAAAVTNKNRLEPIRSRPAGDVLRDINRWYCKLKELPGQGEYNGGSWLEPAPLRALYLKNGWPDAFDGDAFEVDMARQGAVESARFSAEQPLRQVECYEGWVKYIVRDVERYTKEVSEAKTLDEEWKARFALWKAEERNESNNEDLRKAKEKAEKMCPGGKAQREEDLPLWELEKLRVETQWKRESAQRTEMPEQFKNNPMQIHAWEAGQRRAKQELEVYEAAFEASKADADRLCPGRTFQEATGIKSLGREDTITSIAGQKKLVKYYEDYTQTLYNFAASVPEGAPEAKDTVEKDIEQTMDQLKGVKDRLKSLEEWLAEHGNTD